MVRREPRGEPALGQRIAAAIRSWFVRSGDSSAFGRRHNRHSGRRGRRVSACVPGGAWTISSETTRSLLCSFRTALCCDFVSMKCTAEMVDCQVCERRQACNHEQHAEMGHRRDGEPDSGSKRNVDGQTRRAFGKKRQDGGGGDQPSCDLETTTLEGGPRRAPTAGGGVHT
jgi:hypothetical protein